MEHLLGFCAAVISFTMFIPQARSTWKSRNSPVALLGVSVGTQWMIVANAILWGLYGIVTQAFWAAAPGIVNLPLALYTIFAVIMAKKTLEAQSEAVIGGLINDVKLAAEPDVAVELK